MNTTIQILKGTAAKMHPLADASIDLIVTSPPYPMIEMWDEVFSTQDQHVAKALGAARGGEAFELMHSVLDAAWSEVHRVLKQGGIACINIGDATRTLGGDFRLYSNHSRILRTFLDLGFAALPDILWRKQTNSPNKFLGSGMLPVGAYVTYEHEYVLILRKGARREFTSERDKARRKESAFFWEERNVWFSDVWFDIKGAQQGLVDETARRRSAAFPFELAYRLICMFSVKGDLVLDPFAGTGTTLAAALAACRNALGIEKDETFLPVVRSFLEPMPRFANRHIRDRLRRHLEFVAARTADVGPLKHRNTSYGFPVVTSQEKQLLLNDVIEVRDTADGLLTVSYQDGPQADFVREWTDEEIARFVDLSRTKDAAAPRRKRIQSPAQSNQMLLKL